MYHQYPFRLSGGQRQRVMIAMALALEPTILIADEPTTALDVTTQAQILELIRDIQRRKGMSVMFITHDFGVVAEIADSVVVMEKGHIVEQGSAEQVLKAPKPSLYPAPDRGCPPPARRGPRPPGTGQQGADPEGRGPGQDLPQRQCPVRRAARRARRQRGLVRSRAWPHTWRRGRKRLGQIVAWPAFDQVDGQRRRPDPVRGPDIAKLSEAEFRPLRPRIQMIFQDPFASLNPRSTIGHILTVGPVAHGTPYAQAREEAKALLAHVGLDAGAFGRYPHEFSGGQRQRIGIARALMFKPKLLIADEAVSALDVSIQAQILKLLDQIQRETGVSMIFITHDLRVASQICDEIAVMQKGRIVERGPPSQIFLDPQSAYTRELVAAIPGEQPGSAGPVAANG